MEGRVAQGRRFWYRPTPGRSGRVLNEHGRAVGHALLHGAEQIAADRAALGPATDVYALGAILYELLTGRPPFLAASPIETYDQIRNAEPASPRRLNPSIPRDLDTIALRCLQKDSRKRYPTAEALADDLNRFLEGRPIKARPVSPIEHAWRWCRRQPVIAALAATVLLMLIGGFLGLLALLRRTEAQRSRSEANYQVASRSLDEITRILSDELRDDPLKHEGPNSKKALEIARSLEIELSKRYPLDIPSVKRLATTSVLLALFYSRDGKRDEARSLIQEAIGHSDAYLAVSTGDADLQHRLFELVAWMLSDLTGSENDRFYEQCNAQAIALLERLKSIPNVHVADLSQLSSCHRLRADYLLLSGQSDRARKELEQDLAARPVRAGCGNHVSRIRPERGIDAREVGTMVGRIPTRSIPDTAAASKRRDPRVGTRPRRTDGDADRLAAVDCQVSPGSYRRIFLPTHGRIALSPRSNPMPGSSTSITLGFRRSAG